MLRYLLPLLLLAPIAATASEEAVVRCGTWDGSTKIVRDLHIDLDQNQVRMLAYEVSLVFSQNETLWNITETDGMILKTVSTENPTSELYLDRAEMRVFYRDNTQIMGNHSETCRLVTPKL